MEYRASLCRFFNPVFCSLSDELSSILKKLSLEKYQPIFEEQEVLNLQSAGNYKVWFSFPSIRFDSQPLSIKEAALITTLYISVLH